MKSDNTVRKVNRLLDFVSDSDEMSISEIKSELRSEGVDVEKFLEKVNRTVRRGIQCRIKDEFILQEAVAERSFSVRFDELKGWSLEKCVDFLKNIAQGESCTQSQQKIAMAFRNRQDARSQTLEELRSCIADILSLEDKDEK